MNEETYYDSAEGIDITQDRALEELARHGITSNEDIIQFFEIILSLGFMNIAFSHFLKNC